MNNKPCENCETIDHQHTTLPQPSTEQNTEQTQENNQETTPDTQNGVSTSLPQTPSTGSIRVPNHIEGEIKPNIEENSINADNVVENNLVEKGEFLTEETNTPNTDMDNLKRSSPATTEEGKNIQPKTEEDSIFNENPNENNKALTA